LSETTEQKTHLSYSELVQWNFCSHFHKLKYIDKADIPDNYDGPASAGILGTALHYTCEQIMHKRANTDEEQWNAFLSSIEKSLKDEENKLSERDKKKLLNESAMIEEHKALWKPIFSEIEPAFKDYFGEYEVVATEFRLMELIEYGNGWNFKGFIDLILKTSDGKYHIVDLKSCSFGWLPEKKNSAIVNYQLTLYKIFYSQKTGIPLENIETHFALLKRTAKKNRVEIFRVTSGNKKMQNANDLLRKALYNLQNKRYLKNRSNCGNCKLFHTPHCS